MTSLDTCFISFWDWVFATCEPIFPRLFIISVHNIPFKNPSPDQFIDLMESLPKPKHSWWTWAEVGLQRTDLTKSVVVFRRAIPYTTRSGERVLISGRPPKNQGVSVVHFESNYPPSEE